VEEQYTPDEVFEVDQKRFGYTRDLAIDHAEAQLARGNPSYVAVPGLRERIDNERSLPKRALDYYANFAAAGPRVATGLLSALGYKEPSQQLETAMQPHSGDYYANMAGNFAGQVLPWELSAGAISKGIVAPALARLTPGAARTIEGVQAGARGLDEAVGPASTNAASNMIREALGTEANGYAGAHGIWRRNSWDRALSNMGAGGVLGAAGEPDDPLHGATEGAATVGVLDLGLFTLGNLTRRLLSSPVQSHLGSPKVEEALNWLASKKKISRSALDTHVTGMDMATFQAELAKNGAPPIDLVKDLSLPDAAAFDIFQKEVPSIVEANRANPLQTGDVIKGKLAEVGNLSLYSGGAANPTPLVDAMLEQLNVADPLPPGALMSGLSFDPSMQGAGRQLPRGASQPLQMFGGVLPDEAAAEIYGHKPAMYGTGEQPPKPAKMPWEGGVPEGSISIVPKTLPERTADLSYGAQFYKRNPTNPVEKLPVQYRVVDATTLDIGDTVLQMRNRETREVSAAQVASLAAKMNAEALVSGEEGMGTGVPLVGADGQVIGGFGRLRAIEKMRLEDPERYMQFQDDLMHEAEKKGISRQVFSQTPNAVLIAEPTVLIEDARAIADQTNHSASMKMSAPEVAIADAKRMKNTVVDAFRIGDSQTIEQALHSPQNREIVKMFLTGLPENDLGELVTKDGKRLSTTGINRIMGAILAKAFPSKAGEDMVTMFTESNADGVRFAKSAVFGSLGKVAKAAELIRSGNRPGHLDITDDLATAIHRVATARAAGPRLAGQIDLFADELTPNQRRLFDFIDTAKSAKPLRESLNEWADRVIASSNPKETPLAGLSGLEPAKLPSSNAATVERLLNDITHHTEEEPHGTSSPENIPDSKDPAQSPPVPEPMAPVVPSEPREPTTGVSQPNLFGSVTPRGEAPVVREAPVSPEIQTKTSEPSVIPGVGDKVQMQELPPEGTRKWTDLLGTGKEARRNAKATEGILEDFKDVPPGEAPTAEQVAAMQERMNARALAIVEAREASGLVGPVTQSAYSANRALVGANPVHTFRMKVADIVKDVVGGSINEVQAKAAFAEVAEMLGAPKGATPMEVAKKAVQETLEMVVDENSFPTAGHDMGKKIAMRDRLNVAAIESAATLEGDMKMAKQATKIADDLKAKFDSINIPGEGVPSMGPVEGQTSEPLKKAIDEVAKKGRENSGVDTKTNKPKGDCLV